MSFLGLPVELRLNIYDNALQQSTQITVGSAELTGSAPDIVHRLYGDGRRPFPGLQHNHEPVIFSGYDASLLSIDKPGRRPATGHTDSERDFRYLDTQQSLLRVNRQVHIELKSHLAKRDRQRNASVFVSYPSGLHILRTLCPGLLQQARSVHIAGVYRKGKANANQETKRHNACVPDSTAQLTTLLTSCIGPKAIHNIQHLDLRIYYAGPDSYSMIWSPEASPVVVALTQIPNAEFDITLYRGSKGTGVHLRIRPSEGRVVKTVWRPLQERPGDGDWLVDPRWPGWGDAEQAEGGAVVEG